MTLKRKTLFDKVMPIKRATRVWLLASVAVAAQLSWALDLPTKTVKGKEYYVYEVKSGDNLDKIVNKIGVTRAEILKYNNSASDGIKTGQSLYFPVDKFKDRHNVNASTEANVGTSTHSDDSDIYVVQKGETLYGIANRHGVSIDEIIELNPDTESGVKTGQKLRMPSKEQAPVNVAQRSIAPIEQPKEQKEQAKTEIKAEPKAEPVQEPVKEQAEVQAPETAPEAEQAPREITPRRVALLFPFMLDSEKQTKQTAKVNDFYRGFLLAVDSLSTNHRKIEIHTYDTGGDLERVKKLLASEKAIADADIIIAPDEETQFAAITKFASRNGIYVLNPFIVKDTTYMSVPVAMQLNISQKMMLDKAAKYMTENLDGATPVFIVNTQGKREKQAFVDRLKAELDSRGIDYRDFEFTGNLQSSTLEETFGTNGRYVFIPLSGTYNEFAKIRTGLTKFKENATLDGGSVRVFGYPDWIAFRGDNLESLSKLDATIYSRFMLDPNSIAYRAISDSFVHWFRTTPADGVPSMGLLGFDIATYIMTAFNHSDEKFDRDDTQVSVRGVQNSFNFVDGGAGLINNSLYIIRYMPGGYIDTTLL